MRAPAAVAVAALAAAVTSSAGARPGFVYDRPCEYYAEFEVDTARVPDNGFINFGIDVRFREGSGVRRTSLVDIADDEKPTASTLGPGISWRPDETRERAFTQGRIRFSFFVNATRDRGSAPPPRYRGVWAYTIDYVTPGATCDAEPGREAAHVLALSAPLARRAARLAAAGEVRGAAGNAFRLDSDLDRVLERFPMIWRGARSGALLKMLAHADNAIDDTRAQLRSAGRLSPEYFRKLDRVHEAFRLLETATNQRGVPLAVRGEAKQLVELSRRLDDRPPGTSVATRSADLKRITERKRAMVRRLFPRLFGRAFVQFLTEVEKVGPAAQDVDRGVVHRRPELVAQSLATLRRALQRIDELVR